ncbi:MAG: phosphoglucosamine mutase [Gemmatimonadota bacterium]|nr:phosphoglucosamine mutase [Gemmatimonadota bacterium]MDE3005243.1 phosphoglucosamine mutase [Gemmatimonadota bacterium]MDE3012659.1 phosphoglucosamine mutase [Gemmatimonadota bacterium]
MPIHLPEGLMVSVSGVRGRVGAPLTPELMSGIAAALGAHLREVEEGRTVVLGRDSRVSGPMFARAVTAGLQSVGCDVIDVGVVPTPTILMAVRHHGAIGGIGVTASHNPAEWNALKLVSSEGIFLDADRSARFREYLVEQDPPRATWDELGCVSTDDEAWSRHLEAILDLPQIDVEKIRDANLKVAVDCVHGAGGPVITELLERLGCELVGIGMEPDGWFPRDPEPTAANLADLGRLVSESGAAIGLAIDPDADRLSLVDESGRAMGEDLTLALGCAAVLARTPGPVVTNLSTSAVVEDVARAFDSRLVRSPVGEVNVARRMQAEGAVVGGEGNGGLILPALHHTRDAPLASALILQHLAEEGLTPSEAADRWPRYEIVKEKISFPREALQDGYSALEADLAADSRDESDGLRLAWKDKGAWLHVRPSGTEPVVRLIAEAPSRDVAQELVDRAGRLLNGVA